MKLYSDICNYIKSGGYSQIPNLSSTTPNPDYNFTRVNPGVLKTSNIPIIMDVTPTPTTTPRPVTVSTVSVPTKNVNMNVFRKPVNKLGKMF